MTKKTFIDIINRIKEQDRVDSEASRGLELLTDTHVTLNSSNEKYGVMWDLLEKAMNDKNKWIQWWLYEDTDKIVTLKDGTKTDLTSIEDLYDFLLVYVI